MKKMYFIIFLLLTIKIFSQSSIKQTPFIEGSIIFKNLDSINGLVRLASSAFDIRFKDSLKQKRERKIKYKNIEKLTIHMDSLYHREFYYKNTDENKFLHFVELIRSGSISIYISSTNNVGLFYGGSGLKRKSAMKYRNNYKQLHFGDEIDTGGLIFYLKKSNQDKLTLIASPIISVRFKKNAVKYFEDCPKLIEKINSNDLKLKQLPEIIKFYNTNCNK